MASGMFIAVLAATLLIFVSTISVEAGRDGGRNGEGREHGGHGGHKGHGGHGGHKGNGGPGGPPGQCYAYPREIECLHDHLELVLRVAVTEYVNRNPELRRQAPWFDAFKHVNIPSDAFLSTSLSLLSSMDVRESISLCANTLGNKNSTYIPSAPGQMYKDLCSENVLIQSQIQ